MKFISDRIMVELKNLEHGIVSVSYRVTRINNPFLEGLEDFDSIELVKFVKSFRPDFVLSISNTAFAAILNVKLASKPLTVASGDSGYVLEHTPEGARLSYVEVLNG